MDSLRIVEVEATNKELQGLIAKLDTYLYERYPSDEVFGLDLEAAAEDDDIVFVLAYAGENAVGCGAYRPIDAECVELKRFFVEPVNRGSGVAKAVFLYLENKARAEGFASMKLEAGEEQPEALRFYTKNGFARIDRFGPYVDSESSVCMEKSL